jgi:hypothetical protein
MSKHGGGAPTSLDTCYLRCLDVGDAAVDIIDHHATMVEAGMSRKDLALYMQGALDYLADQGRFLSRAYIDEMSSAIMAMEADLEYPQERLYG